MDLEMRSSWNIWVALQETKQACDYRQGLECQQPPEAGRGEEQRPPAASEGSADLLTP